MSTFNKVTIESWRADKPRSDTTFAVVFPHSDDFSIFTGGLIEKLITEGATGYFIRTTNDEMDSFDLTAGETMFRIERETYEVARYWGIKKVFDLNYKNHYLDHSLLTEIRHRLITLFRYLKVDTVVSFDPWGHYEENPDHYITAMAVEQSCWMSGRKLDLPELTDMGIRPHFVKEKYYVARGPQLTNLVIDISSVYEKKLHAIIMHKTPIDNMWKEHLEENKGHTKYSNAPEYVKDIFMDNAPEFCGLKQCEKYHYIYG